MNLHANMPISVPACLPERADLLSFSAKPGDAPAMAAAPSRPSLAFVPTRYYAALLAFVEERGFSKAEVVEGTGVSLEMLGTDESYLTLDQVIRFVQRASELVPGDEMPLEVGQRLMLGSHGAVGVAALTASSVEAAFHVVLRYFALVTPLFDVAFRTEGSRGAVRLRARWPLPPVVERFQLATMTGSLYAQGTFLVRGGLPPGLEVDAKHARPAHLPSWVDESGVVVRFDQPEHEVRFPAELARRVSPLADPVAHAAACKTCEALLAARPDPLRLASSIRRLLEEAGPPYLDLDTVASRLFLSTRTLRRRLAEEGTSYRELLEDVRLARADAWLSDGDRSITQIGLELGYADASNFTRAYRRARGESPLSMRRARASAVRAGRADGR